MVQLSFVSTAAALLLAALPLVAAAEPLQKPKQAAVLGSFTSQGCFSTGQGLKKQKSVNGTENSSASCGAACLEQTKLVFAMTSDACYCGDKYPPEVDIIDDAKCTYKCKGNKKEACGSKSDKRYSVWNSGVKLDVEYAKKKTSNTKTVTKLATKTPTATKSSKSTKTSKSTKKTPSSTTTSQIETHHKRQRRIYQLQRECSLWYQRCGTDFEYFRRCLKTHDWRWSRYAGCCICYLICHLINK